MAEMTTRASHRAAPSTSHARRASHQTAANPLLVQLRLPRAATALYDPVMTENASANDHDERDDDAATSDSSDSGDAYARKRTGDSTTATARASKKRRKPTSTVRKEEKQSLLEELSVLEARVGSLRSKVGLPSLVENRALKRAQQKAVALEETQRNQILALCRGQAMLSQYMRDLFSGPLKVPIVLGKDPAQRRAALLAIRRPKLNIAYQYLESRLAGVDERTPFTDTQSWVSSSGDYCFHNTDITQFEGLCSVKDVFDALMFYMSNMEIAISEQLGQLTLREDFDCDETSISNQRIVSSTEHGVTVEVNSVCFAEYYDAFAERNSEPYGLMTNDSVDVDDLNPYFPESRVQRNVTAAVSVSSFRKPRSAKERRDSEGELVVVLRRCAYLSLKKPQFDVSQDALTELRSSVAAWGNVMAQSVRDRVYAVAASGHTP